MMQRRGRSTSALLPGGRIFAAGSIWGVIQAVLQVPAKALDPDLHAGLLVDELTDIAGGEAFLGEHSDGGFDLVQFGADSVGKPSVFFPGEGAGFSHQVFQFVVHLMDSFFELLLMIPNLPNAAWKPLCNWPVEAS